MQALRRLEQERNATGVTDLSILHTGQVVRFYNPAFNGLKGLVKSVSSHRVTVLMELVGRQKVVSADHEQLEAV